LPLRHEVEQLDRWLNVGAADKANSVLELTRGLPIRDVIEIGTGTGGILDELDRRGYAERYWACEPSAPLFEQLLQKRISRLVGASATTFEQSPFCGMKFDLAILSHVLEHVVDPGRLLSKALERARFVVVEVPIEANVIGSLRAWTKECLTGRPRSVNAAGHVQFFSVEDVRKLARWSGGELIGSFLYFPGSAYRVSAETRGALRKYRFLILGLASLVGPRIMARTYYAHLAVLLRPTETLAPSEGHPLFWRPPTAPSEQSA
jgi:SAM-dependent methyltransferase